MTKLCLIGVGTGNPDHLTFEGAAALRDADLVLIPRKGPDKADLADLRRQICERVLGVGAAHIAEFDMPRRDAEAGYLEGVADWHAAIAEVWQATIARTAAPPALVALLVWGDPSLYDSTLRIAARLDPPPDIRVVPGVTALQALTAAHRIPLNDVGQPVLVTTGRRLRDDGWPAGVDRIAVMLDAGGGYRALEAADFDIWWGAYLGMPEELLIQGRLADVADEIERTRAAARAGHGWIMDIYILSRRSAPDR